ncbi:MAG: ectonucleotide pyrophosphatase/phosphodiesterase [Chitinophagaceae bacterium]
MFKKVLLVAAALLTAAVSFSQQVKHVIIISIDGFRPDFYMDPSWNAVNLQQMKANGVSAQGVQGVFPSVTYPSHTAVITGALPIHHGIYYNVYFEPWDTPGRWYWNESEIKVPTLWDAVSKAGMTTASVHWPVTVGAPITWNIPEVWNWPGKKTLLGKVSEKANPPGLFEEAQQNATGKLEEVDYNGDYLSADENMARIAGYLIRKNKPNLLAIHLANTDHFEHEQGRDGEKVRLSVASADRAVRTILESIDKAGIRDSTAVLVLGDHGFSNIHSTMFPNIWLRDNGFATPSQDGSKENWKALFHSNGGSAFLHLKDKNDKATVQKLRTILKNLPEGQRRMFRIVERAEMDSIGADPNAVLALTAIQGVSFSASDKGKETVREASGGTHGYFPDFKEIQTGFIGYGPGFKKGVVIPVMGLQDMAPIVAALLGIQFEAPDGVLYPGILESKKK